MIRTDARGIAFIFDRKKTTCKRALTRAEGWALRLNVYDYEIEWIKGSRNIADPPSRLSSEPEKTPILRGFPGEICTLQSPAATPIGSLTAADMRKATEADAELREASEMLKTGESEGQWPPHLKAYEKVRDELRVENGLLVRLGAIVTPRKLRSRVLDLAHKGHPGQAAMKSIMRKRVWWPGMAKDADEFVQNCAACNLAAKPEFPIPMRSSALPQEPWEKLAVDFNGPHARLGGCSIFVMVDYFSRFVAAEMVKSTDMASIEPALLKYFGIL